MSDETMVERVASVVRTHAHWMANIVTTRGTAQAMWSKRLAAVLLKELREPTQSIMEAIIASFGSDDDRSAPERALDAWIAGIDAALSPQPETKK